MKRIATIMAALALLVLVPGTALASSSSCQGYNTAQLCTVSAITQSKTPATTAPVSSVTTTSPSSLPFTGLDVGLLALGGVVLLGSGLFVRRASRRLN
jgi:hypothetical protein